MATSDLARQEHQNLELWEVEVSNREEVDLHLHLKDCPKNPDHINFIPIHQFSVDNLPPAYHDKYIVDFVKAMADLTVCVYVKYVSMKRPKTFPDSIKPFPFYVHRGSYVMRKGTGWVDSVEVGPKNVNCWCQGCLKSSNPSKEHARILIKTAAHVAYDDEEGAHTVCHLFFDKGVKPDSSNGAISLSGMCRVRSNSSIDWCEMVYTTHDMDLTNRLINILQTWTELREKINLKYCCGPAYKKQLFNNREPLPHSRHKLSIIVSHPHGCSKQVTIGERIEQKSIDKDWCKYTYSTATCPGSSGALVFLMGRESMNWAVKFSHWGTSEGQTDQNEKLWEVEVNNIEEADLHVNLKNCRKNPNHTKFIPIHKFTLDNLPSEYRDSDVLDFIQTMADLTVHVSVKYVSMKRPKTFPGSLTPYPFYDYRGSHATRTGTGWVDSVEIMPEECTCQKCIKSSKRNEKWARISIKTASHVVYDDEEGAFTVCHLFFDKGVKPDSKNGVVTLSGMSRVRSNSSIDWCEMLYITHDIEFANKMYFNIKSWTYFRERVNLKYRNAPKFEENMGSSGEEQKRSEHKLSIIVSHPHGCSKQVTIGEWIEKKFIDNDWCKYTYNTATCPGSSGAHVFFLGLEWINWMVKFSHWGVSEKQVELNESNFMREN